MFAFRNKQISMAHIMKAEWLDKTVTVNHPNLGKVTMYGFKLTLSNGHEEQLLFDDEQDRHASWTKLIEDMGKAGY